MSTEKPPKGLASAFTLIELLVVITVISLLLAFSAPALFNGLAASRLTGAGDLVLTSLSEAQQTAFAQNVAVEIQFYSYPDINNTSTDFHSFRLFKVTTLAGAGNEALVSLGALVKLPDGVLITPDARLSPSLEGTAIPDTKRYSGVVGATYAAIRFLPDGTCRRVMSAPGSGLSSLLLPRLQESFLTLVEDDGSPRGAADIPRNFYTIQVDPFTGKARSYRPGF